MERKINILFIDTSYANKNPLQYLNENKKLMLTQRMTTFQVMISLLNWNPTHSEMFESRTLIRIHSIGRRQKRDYRGQMLYINQVVIRRISGPAREPTVREDPSGWFPSVTSAKRNLGVVLKVGEKAASHLTPLHAAKLYKCDSKKYDSRQGPILLRGLGAGIWPDLT